jgi:hypothetical protein
MSSRGRRLTAGALVPPPPSAAGPAGDPSEVESLSLAGELDSAVDAEAGGVLGRLPCERLQARVVVTRVVVEQEQTLRLRALRECEGVAEA